jgi:hypothetical protein
LVLVEEPDVEYMLIILITIYSQTNNTATTLSMARTPSKAACESIGQAAVDRWKLQRRAVDFLCEPLERR